VNGESSHRRLLARFAGRAGYALGLRVLWALISFGGAALLARWFSAEDFGHYGSVISLITFLSVVCGLGAPNALIRLLAEFGGDHPEGEKAALAHGAIRATHAAVLAVSTGVALLIAAGAIGLHLAHRLPEWLVYVAGAALLPAFTVTDVQAAAARSYGRVFAALAPKDILWRLLIIPLAWWAATSLPQTMQLIVFLALAAVSLTAFAIAQAWALRRAAPKAVWAATPVYRLHELRRISTSTWITQVASSGFRTLDVVIAGLFLPPHQVGLYFAATRVAGLISFVLISTNLILGPEVAKLHHSGSHAQLTRTLKLASLIVFLPSFVGFLGCVTFPDQILGLFGKRYAGAHVELIILAIGQMMNAATGCVGVVLMMTGLERKNAEILVTTSIATIAVMAGLTYAFGSVGTAIAASGGLTATTVRLWLVARRHTAYDPSILGLFRRSGA